MAIAEDASAPAVATGTGSGTLTSASFSPPANTLLVAMVVGGWGSSAMATTVTDSGSHTWIKIAEAVGTDTSNRGVASMWCTYLSSAPGSITVSVAYTNLSGGRYLAVKVLTGAASSQSSATGHTAVNGTTKSTTTGQITFTTTTTGSMVYGASDGPFNAAAMTAIAGSTLISSFNNTTDTIGAASWESTAATGTPGSTTFGGTWSTSDEGNVAAFEVLPLLSLPSESLFVPRGQAVARSYFR